MTWQFVTRFGRYFGGLGRDVRLALRLIRHQPGFAAISIAMIALAIAASTTLFSVVSGVLLKPLPQIKTDGLVRVFERHPAEGNRPTFSNVTYFAWGDHPETIEGLAAWNDAALSYDGPSGPELVRGAKITANLFSVIGASPVLGVTFTEDEEVSDDAVILSHGLWTERFGAAPDALGRRLTIGGKPRTIIGVMPRGFAFPDRDARLWLAQRLPQVITRERRPFGFSVTVAISAHNGLARLKPGVTPQQAVAEANARVAQTFTGRGGPGTMFRNATFELTPMLDFMVKDVTGALWILSAAVILLFVAAIGNVASMQLARAASRERDVAIRAALGGGRLTRQLLVETSALAIAGSAAGLAITVWLLRALPALMPEDFPRLDDIAVDMRVLLVTSGLTLAVSLALGLIPARMVRRVKLTRALAEDGAAPVGPTLRTPAARYRAFIITGQVAIASLLLVGAALLGQSLFKLIEIDRGYEPDNVLTARIAHLAANPPKSARTMFHKDVLDRLAATPGVTHAALSDDLPLTATSLRTVGWRVNDRAQRMEAEAHVATTGYLASMGMRLVRGRGFTDGDVLGSELVVLVNETFAKRYLPVEPLNVRLDLELDPDRPCAPTKETQSACTNPWRVIGIVADVKHAGADAHSPPEIFAVRSQLLSAPPPMQFVTVRTTGDPALLAGTLRSIVKDASATGVVEQVMTMETRLMMSLARPRLYAVLLGGFAAFALLIAAIGLFGGVSYGVAQRTREIGVRTALGATPADIVRLVLTQSAVMTAAGLAIGLGGAAVSVRYLAAFLFGVEPLDAATFAVVGGALALAALIACGIPARRAARIDPISALRR